jgi:hypothetical protein
MGTNEIIQYHFVVRTENKIGQLLQSPVELLVVIDIELPVMEYGSVEVNQQ